MHGLPDIPDRGTLKGADLTREKLLQATHELLFQSAGAEPSVSQICERAGVQAGMVSYCFGGKDGLFTALIERTTRGVIAGLERLAATDLPPEEKLRRHVAAVIRNYVSYPYANQFSERLAAGDRTGSRMAELVGRPMLAFYRDLLDEAAPSGVFRDIDPTFLFFSVVGMCEFVFAARSWMEGPGGRPIDEELIERFTEHTVALVLHGIGSASCSKASSSTTTP